MILSISLRSISLTIRGTCNIIWTLLAYLSNQLCFLLIFFHIIMKWDFIFNIRFWTIIFRNNLPIDLITIIYYYNITLYIVKTILYLLSALWSIWIVSLIILLCSLWFLLLYFLIIIIWNRPLLFINILLPFMWPIRF